MPKVLALATICARVMIRPVYIGHVAMNRFRNCDPVPAVALDDGPQLQGTLSSTYVRIAAALRAARSMVVALP